LEVLGSGWAEREGFKGVLHNWDICLLKCFQNK